MDGPEQSCPIYTSIDMLSALTIFYQHMEQAACCPRTWCQVHLPKPKSFRSNANACDVSALRSISVTSVFWRLRASNRIKHDSAVQRLQQSILALDNEVATQLCMIHSMILMPVKILQVLIIVWLSTVLTHVWLCMPFASWGMPENMVGLMTSMWCNQQRLFQFIGQTSADPVTVPTALLQGDPWSMIALNACLLAPIFHMKEISSQTRQTVLCWWPNDHKSRH
jgi:hypothetical protein